MLLKPNPKQIIQKNLLAWDYIGKDFQACSGSSLIGVILNGRYPEEGTAMNKECEQMCMIIEGEGHFYVEGEKTLVVKGDLFYIPKGKKYFMNGNDLSMWIANSPAYFDEQHVINLQTW